MLPPPNLAQQGELNCTTETIVKSISFGGAVSKAANFVVRFENMRLLFTQQLRDISGQCFVQGFRIHFLGFVLSLFCSFQQRMVAAAQLRFQVSPDAVNGTSRSTTLFDVVHSQTMELVL